MNIFFILLTISQCFFPTTLKFVTSVALKLQFTSKLTRPDIGKKNFPITQAQYVMDGYNSPEQSI